MSGICGIVSLGRGAPPPDAAALRRLTEKLERRGPDGTGHWPGESAALGHTCLASTPEAAAEVMPFVHAGSGCVVTADIRLDNREDLSEQLSIDLRARVVGDGELVLAAWLKWGEACPEHLLGDFAFALWDPRARKLFAARDQMGMKPFIYGVTGDGRMIFASGAKAVHRMAPEAFPLNAARIADYLEDMEGIDLTSTFFRGIHRLPPAHRLVFDPQGLRLSRYWTLEMPPERTRASETEHAEVFLEAFTAAVRARLRSNGPVGSMMSGGMDSSSIVAIAADQLAQLGAAPLRTYSLVSPSPEGCRETQAVDAMMAVPGILPTRIHRDGPEEMLQVLFDGMRGSEEPFDSTMSILRAVYGAAQRDGLRGVFDGGAGDVVFTEGDVHARLLRQGRWRDIFEDAAGARQFWGGHGPHPMRALAAALWRVTVPEPVRLARRRLLSQLREPRPLQPGMVSDLLARQVDIRARRRAFFSPRSPDQAGGSPRLGAVLGYNLTVGRERYDRVASEFGIEPRDPFMDLRVIRACLSAPPNVMHAKGWPKYLLRQAMQGQLPDVVRWRQDKSHLGWQLTGAVLTRLSRFGAVEADVLRAHGVHEDAIRRLLKRAPDAPLTNEDATLIYLALWTASR